MRYLCDFPIAYQNTLLYIYTLTEDVKCEIDERASRVREEGHVTLIHSLVLQAGIRDLADCLAVAFYRGE